MERRECRVDVVPSYIPKCVSAGIGRGRRPARRKNDGKRIRTDQHHGLLCVIAADLQALVGQFKLTATPTTVRSNRAGRHYDAA